MANGSIEYVCKHFPRAFSSLARGKFETAEYSSPPRPSSLSLSLLPRERGEFSENAKITDLEELADNKSSPNLNYVNTVYSCEISYYETRINISPIIID